MRDNKVFARQVASWRLHFLPSKQCRARALQKHRAHKLSSPYAEAK